MTGSGTLIDPYIIWDVTDLQNMNLDLTAYYELGADIDASATVGWNGGAGFDPIGSGVNAFTGSFNGRGYTISELFIDRPATDYVALFAQLSAPAVVENVRLTALNITGADSTAGLAGWVNISPVVIRSIFLSGVILGDDEVGALIGAVRALAGVGTYTISGCSSSCTVQGDDYVGGLIGYIWLRANNILDIDDSNATGNVTATGWASECGGFIGDAFGANAGNALNIDNCYAAGDVNGADTAGGFAGYILFNALAVFTSCYSTGIVTGGGGTGGFVGIMGGDLDSCYSTGNVISTGSYTGGFAGNGGGVWVSCYSIGNVNAVNVDAVGGFIGWHEFGVGSITDCYSTGNVVVAGVAFQRMHGGFVGENDNPIAECYCIGNVTSGAIGHRVGGFAGYNDNDGDIQDCYCRGDVIADADIGGFLGNTWGALSSVQRCYSTGAVVGNTNVGGFNGRNQGGGPITDCFWDVDTSGQAASPNGTGMTTEQMQDKDTFSAWDLLVPWIIAEVTNSPASVIGASYATVSGTLVGEVANDLYPYLRFQTVSPSLCNFEYGGTVVFGTSTPVVSKTRGESFEAALVGLSVGRDYYFRAKASN